jgi:cell division protein FtsZ
MADEIIQLESITEEESIIKVIGVGGGGSNAVNHMYNLGIKGVNFVVCNTDGQALQNSPVPVKIQLGQDLTHALGAGNEPLKGEQSALENLEDLKSLLENNTRMVFLTAGMGGGTGTGAVPVIAKLTRELDILTVAIVTLPFSFEGDKRWNQAIEGIRKMKDYTDALLIIHNDRLREIYGDQKLSVAFSNADDVLAMAAKGIAEIITVHGYVNVDFADVETVMRGSGVAIMGTGVAEGEDRAREAIKKALISPLLNNNNLKGAKNILLNINSGSKEVLMDEVTEIMEFIQRGTGIQTDIIWGNGYDESLADSISVTIVATGLSSEKGISDLVPDLEPRTFRLDGDDGPEKLELSELDEDKPESEIVFEVEQGNDDERHYRLKDPKVEQPEEKPEQNNKTKKKNEKKRWVQISLGGLFEDKTKNK